MKIEKEWTTRAGLKAEVIAHDMGHRCGYVGVSKDHPWYGKTYNEVDLDVHGGLTYAGMRDDLWWFGYDCAHLGDARDPELMSDEFKSIRIMLVNFDGDTVKTLDFCVNECEAMAAQLGALKEHAMREVQRLGQEIEQEPARWEVGVVDGVVTRRLAPPQRTWVGLTDEDYFAVLEKLQNLYHRPPIAIFAKAIEATLKEKNCG